jgi:hypothetical protein
MFKYIVPLLAFSFSVAHAQTIPTTQFDTITVYAETYYAPGGLAPALFTFGPGSGKECGGRADGYCQDTVHEADHNKLCANILARAQSTGCNLAGYPAIPEAVGFPGLPTGTAWAPNACGSGEFSTAFASIAQSLLHVASYSGDFERPVKNNPNLSFGGACSNHDRCYTSAGSTKGSCDNAFLSNLDDVCFNAATDAIREDCRDIADSYFQGVSLLGQGAFTEDQSEVQCNRLGRSAKKNHCGP